MYKNSVSVFLMASMLVSVPVRSEDVASSIAEVVASVPEVVAALPVENAVSPEAAAAVVATVTDVVTEAVAQVNPESVVSVAAEVVAAAPVENVVSAEAAAAVVATVTDAVTETAAQVTPENVVDALASNAVDAAEPATLTYFEKACLSCRTQGDKAAAAFKKAKKSTQDAAKAVSQKAGDLVKAYKEQYSAHPSKTVAMTAAAVAVTGVVTYAVYKLYKKTCTKKAAAKTEPVFAVTRR